MQTTPSAANDKISYTLSGTLLRQHYRSELFECVDTDIQIPGEIAGTLRLLIDTLSKHKDHKLRDNILSDVFHNFFDMETMKVTKV